jgi:DNA-3-methyladenine glycosylase
MKKLPQSYYLNPDVIYLARNLLGKVLITNINGQGVTSGRIVETEAYAGITDKASHAFGGRRTKRTETMYLEGGVSYVYLCYGIHHMFNVVVGSEDVPNAVLIRAIEPLQGLGQMSSRTEKQMCRSKRISGPGNVTKALGIKKQHDKIELWSDAIWIEDGKIMPNENMMTTTRIGIDYAAEDAILPYRFLLKETR